MWVKFWLKIVLMSRCGFIYGLKLYWCHIDIQFLAKNCIDVTLLVKILPDKNCIVIVVLLRTPIATLCLPYFTEQLRSLRRQRQREYQRHGNEQLERIQRICINTILLDTGVKVNCMVACTLLNLEPLFYRRQSLCIKFIQKASQDPRHSDMFSRNNNACNTRANKPKNR